MDITLTEKEIICNCINELPPGDWLHDCNTPDRVEHWKDVKLYFSCLHESLSTYFSGSEPSEAKLPPELREHVALVRDDYLSLYALIRECWSEIVQDLAKNDIELPSTPGEGIKMILEWECACLFAQAFPELSPFSNYEGVSPRKIYESRAKEHKLNKKLEEYCGKSLPRPLQTRLNNRNAELKKQVRQMSGFMLRDNCLTVCERVAAQNRTVRRKLHEHAGIAKRLRDENLKEGHPSKGNLGWQWVSGQRLQGKKHKGFG
jgi:hypothetical protein